MQRVFECCWYRSELGAHLQLHTSFPTAAASVSPRSGGPSCGAWELTLCCLINRFFGHLASLNLMWKILLQCCNPDTFTVKNKHAMSIQVYSQKCYKHAFKLEVIQLFLVYICNHSIRMSHLGFCPLLRTSICPSKSLVWHMTSHWMATSGWKKGCKVGTHCKQSTGMARGWHKKSQESGWRGLEEEKLQLLNIQICIELGWIVVDII